MISYRIITTNNELYHHGIKGQKWYVRRYQNEDGTLTDLGKKRYSKEKTATIDKMSNDQLARKWGQKDARRLVGNLTGASIATALTVGALSAPSTAALATIGMAALGPVGTGIVLGGAALAASAPAALAGKVIVQGLFKGGQAISNSVSDKRNNK